MVSFNILAPLAAMTTLYAVQTSAADIDSSRVSAELTSDIEPTPKPQQSKCEDGEVHCLEKNQYKICEDGVWSAPKNLKEGQSCSDNVDGHSNTNGAGTKSFGFAAAAAAVVLMQFF